jgi:3-deoxy-manno-octulosonate cytidylyltransferase (CMP-KDO synthetase)
MVIFAVRPATSFGSLKTLTKSSIVAVIPARYASSRLPGKVLIDLAGKPMIEHVYERAALVPELDAVIVASDDDLIIRTVLAFGGHAERTRATHRSGTERVAEVAARLPCAIIVNIQGDEPLIEPSMIKEALAPVRSEPSVQMCTLRRQITDPEELLNPSIVKVVVDSRGDALYFSRQKIPHSVSEVEPIVYKHIGLYVYRRRFLLELATLPPMPLETVESLEQLRVLEHGFRIRTVETKSDSFGVDTPEDIERVRRSLAEGVRT